MPWYWLLGVVFVLAGSPGVAQERPGNQDIGSWVLSCPQESRTASCQLRHRSWVVPPTPGAPAASLEVVYRGGRFVPALVLRDLSTQAAVGGLLALQPTVGLLFDGARRTELGCDLDGGSVVCAPSDASAAGAAGNLTGSRSVLVQVRVGVPGGTDLPEQARSLELDRTADAVARFRATAPANQAIPAVPGLDWRGFLDRLARDAGWENGLAGVLRKVGGLATGRGP